MKRRILAAAVGLAWLPACGDNGNHAVSDASGGGGQPDGMSPSDAGGSDASSPDAFVDTSLILRYDFEEAATVVKDSSGRGKDGTLSDVAAWTADGRDGRGVAFSAPGGGPATQFVSLPSGVLTDVEDFTISTWFKANSIGNWSRIYDLGNETQWMFLTPRGFVEVQPPQTPPKFAAIGLHASSFAGSAGEIINAANTELPTGVWKHLTVTGSGGTRTVYIDGFPVSTMITSIAAPPKDLEPLAGNSWLGKSRFEACCHDPGLDGTLDDFKIYKRALSQDEISALAWPKLDYSYFRFDETSGSTTKDSSDNAIPAVLANSPTWVHGRLGGAINFGGGAKGDSGPYVKFASSPMAHCTTQLTIAAWIKIHELVPWARVFDFGIGLADGNFMYLAPYDDPNDGTHGMHFAMFSSNGHIDMRTTTPPVPADNDWHHVAVTFLEGHITVYVGGAVLMAQDVTGVTPADFAQSPNNWLGRSQGPEDQYLNAALDELRISCRAYTADEIKSLATPEQP